MKKMQAFQQFLGEINKNPYYAIPLVVWAVGWKGLALWKAAKRDQKPWFIAILVLNTLGLLEIVYLFLVPKLETILKKQK